MVESGDASAVSQRDTGPRREPGPLSASGDGTRQGPDGCLGPRRCQGQPSGLEARRHGAVLLRGGWCGAERPTPRARKHGCVCGHTSGVEMARTERNGKKWSKVAGGRGLSLDKSLLYGCISYPPWTSSPFPRQIRNQAFLIGNLLDGA